MCDVFRETVKLINNHETPFTGAQMGGNEVPRGVNGGNSENGGACGTN